MTQYNDIIKRKAEELSAEEWGNKVKYIHASNGVMEVCYNNGTKEFEETKPNGKKWTEGTPDKKSGLGKAFGAWLADIKAGFDPSNK